MRITASVIVLCAISSILMTPAQADEDENSQPSDKEASVEEGGVPAGSPWDGSVSASYLIENGNSTTRSIYGKGDLSYQWNKWLVGIKGEGGNRRSKSSTSGELERKSERYYAELREERNFNRKDYLFHLSSFRNDNFSSYNYQITDSLGYGRRLLATPTQKLSAEVAPGYRQRKLRDPDPGDKRIERNAIIHLGIDYKWQITDNTEFRENAQSDFAKGDDYTLRLETELVTMLNRHLAFSVGHLLTRDAQVEDGDHKTDSQITLSLTYKLR